MALSKRYSNHTAFGILPVVLVGLLRCSSLTEAPNEPSVPTGYRGIMIPFTDAW
jgi:hypothetical protein